MGKNKRNQEDSVVKSTWVEVGRVFEPYFRKHGGVPLLNVYVYSTAMVMLRYGDDRVLLSDDGDHYRIVAGENEEQPDEPLEHMIFTFWEEQPEQTFLEIEAEIRKDHFNAEAMEANGGDPKDLHRASSFVNQLSDLHDEKGWRELTPGLSDELGTAIQTLEKYKEYAPWVQYTLENALSLRELMPEISVWAHYR